ncbi:MAG: AtpZ/AtpI family protein [Chloracidobacterium sp.]|nr:AtpZ/AtpI family protein [Chloracidobacterium sp.]MCC6825651.1 AtpZ/AtpI family protein [Acidobacteriota bacterium]MCO5333776.1 AtpZ/AtpI family protein [Pyrinomonadaceae bacterium]
MSEIEPEQSQPAEEQIEQPPYHWPAPPPQAHTLEPLNLYEPRPEPQHTTYAPFEPEPVEETVRRAGLAYSIGIAFVVSVAFCLFLGWIADLLLGTKPWGLVGGIVLGSIIGFIQVFRISAQIFGPSPKRPEIRPLLGGDETDTNGSTL